MLTFAAVALNVWFIPMWGVTGSACATLVAYVVYFVPLLTMLWLRLGVTLFSRKQLWVVLLTVLLFGMNIVWEWVVTPMFGWMGSGLAVVLVEAVVRTLFFAVVAVVAVKRLNISAEVNGLLCKIPFVNKIGKK